MTVGSAEENKAIFRAIYDSVGGADPSTIERLVDEGLVTVRPEGHPVGGVFEGRRASGQAREKTRAALGPTRVRVVEVFAEGPRRVVAVMELSGVHPDGTPWSMPTVELADIVEGKLTRIELLVDTARLRVYAEQWAQAEK